MIRILNEATFPLFETQVKKGNTLLLEATLFELGEYPKFFMTHFPALSHKLITFIPSVESQIPRSVIKKVMLQFIRFRIILHGKGSPCRVINSREGTPLNFPIPAIDLYDPYFKGKTQVPFSHKALGIFGWYLLNGEIETHGYSIPVDLIQLGKQFEDLSFLNLLEAYIRKKIELHEKVRFSLEMLSEYYHLLNHF